jgi:two-component system response regulator RegA
LNRGDLLIVEDDAALRQQLTHSLERRGFSVRAAAGVAEGIAAVGAAPPRYAVVDLRLGDGSGLDVVAALHSARPEAKAVVLTGYGNIATAVAAVKLGAVDYLAKPADAEEIVAALMNEAAGRPAAPEHPMSPDRIRWEHIQRVLAGCGNNISEAARKLGLHRRSLQRMLAKRPPRQ